MSSRDRNSKTPRGRPTGEGSCEQESRRRAEEAEAREELKREKKARVRHRTDAGSKKETTLLLCQKLCPKPFGSSIDARNGSTTLRTPPNSPRCGSPAGRGLPGCGARPWFAPDAPDSKTNQVLTRSTMFQPGFNQVHFILPSDPSECWAFTSFTSFDRCFPHLCDIIPQHPLEGFQRIVGTHLSGQQLKGTSHVRFMSFDVVSQLALFHEEVPSSLTNQSSELRYFFEKFLGLASPSPPSLACPSSPPKKPSSSWERGGEQRRAAKRSSFTLGLRIVLAHLFRKIIIFGQTSDQPQCQRSEDGYTTELCASELSPTARRGAWIAPPASRRRP